jgi:hypothetical protein
MRRWLPKSVTQHASVASQKRDSACVGSVSQHASADNIKRLSKQRLNIVADSSPASVASPKRESVCVAGQLNPCLRMRWHPAPIHLKLIGQKQETPL